LRRDDARRLRDLGESQGQLLSPEAEQAVVLSESSEDSLGRERPRIAIREEDVGLNAGLL
jgi:hypothetical protein